MKLDEWMKKEDIKQAHLAKQLGVYPNQIHCLLKGKTRPKPYMAKKIRDLSGGQVTFDDIYGIPSFEEQKLAEKTEKKDPFMPKKATEVPDTFIDSLCDAIYKKLQKRILDEMFEKERIENTNSGKFESMFGGKDSLEIEANRVAKQTGVNVSV